MKILFGISLAAIIAAAALAFMTRSKLIETRTEKDANNRTIYGIHQAVTKVNDETTATWAEWKDTQTKAKDEDTEKKNLDRDTADEVAKLKGLNDRMKEIADERAAMQKEIDDATAEAGGTVDQLAGQVEALEGETVALAQDLAKLNGEMELAKKASGESDAESNRRKGIQNARETTISLTGRAASVLEVNTEFSFVLLNVGRANGLTNDSKLMVMQNGVHIANLKVVALEANRTVADIELKTARTGYQVAAGDRVVIETSVK